VAWQISAQPLPLQAIRVDRCVETVIVGGKVLKWNGQLLNVNLRRIRGQLEASRDFLFDAAGIPQDDLFRPN
jgi:hypothetical protein